MYDYDGDMKFFQDQLARKGISKEVLDTDQYCGLTRRELQGIVDGARRRLTIKTYFGEYKGCCLDVGRYVADGSLAVTAMNRTDGVIARLTVCLDDNELCGDEAYIDVNNCPWAVQLLLDTGIAEQTGRVRQSGYVRYPSMKFNMEKLNACREV